MEWYIQKEAPKKEGRNAAGKAPSDIGTICAGMGMQKLSFPIFPDYWKSEKMQKLWILTAGTIPWIKAERAVSEGDTILLQYPFYGNRVIKKMVSRIREKKHCRFILLLHDLESLRNQRGELDQGRRQRGLYAEKHLFPLFDVIICHNDAMKAYLAGQEIPEDKLVTLQIFDYLTNSQKRKQARTKVPSITVAGNLTKKKSSYLYQIHLSREELTLHLFGNGFEKENGPECAIWHGSFVPEELPEHLEGDFGLVWDGTSADTCEGNTGNYLRYNNPHKTSLYIASGMPVIVWKESAMANYVTQKNIGITVASIAEIPDRIRGISEEDWQRMLNNVQNESQRLRSGYYTRTALLKAMSLMKESI